MRNQFDDNAPSRENEKRPADGGADSGLRAVVLFALSVAIFIFSVVMCLHLIGKSGDVDSMMTEASAAKPLEYEVHVPPTQPVTQGEDDPYQLELKEPDGIYDSPVINILILGVDGDRNDTQILCSVNMAERTLSMLSIPRDTYVAGTYEVPKAMNIYASYDEAKRVDAVKDAILGMFGFYVDYYFVLDQSTLTETLNLINGLSFDVPESPAYHGLQSGIQTLDGETAFELFRFKENWKDVETDSSRVQRMFLLSLLKEALADKSRISEICVKISQVANTDLSVEELAYLAYLLADFNFEEAYNRALPGVEKSIGNETYYEIDPDKAVEMLNGHFNPTEKELTIFSVNFRQEQGASGDGEYSDYGFSSSTEETEGDRSEGNSESGDGQEQDGDNSGDGEEQDGNNSGDGGSQDDSNSGEVDDGDNGGSSEEPNSTEDLDPPTEQEATETPDNGGDSDNGTT